MSTLMTTKPERFRPRLALLLATLALLLTIWPAAAGVHAQSDAPLPSAPAGVTAADGPQTGAVNITWNPVAGAAFYRIGWVNMADIPVAQAAGRHWLDAFAFTDIANLGQRTHTLTDLRPAADYAFIIGSVSARFGAATWSEWAYLTPAAASCSAGSIATDRAALVALYHATDGDNWGANTNWLSDAPLGQWHGVTTDKDGRVIELVLGWRYFLDGTGRRYGPEMKMAGELPAELGDLDRLRELHLGGHYGHYGANRLTGTIPAELGNLANLKGLSLSGNVLTGVIPAELGNLGNLEGLYLNGNQLTGAIPAELGNLSNLEGLYLNDNQLTGAIPAELGNLGNLEGLYLDWNMLTGAIPAELGNLGNLEGLYLNWNVLTGAIPAELGNLNNLQSLELNSNQLTGAMPVELGNLNNLQSLKLNRNQLTGAIPAELSNLNNLGSLYLENNRLSGCIPAVWQISAGRRYTNDLDRLGLSFCNAPSDVTVHHQSDRAALVALYNATDGPNWRDNRNWTSDLPIWEWSGVTVALNGRVTGLDIRDNRLTGEIPTELGNLANLQSLYLSSNQLTGGIPAELGSLANLRRLYLNSNLLTGEIPAELGNLANLQELYLSGNHLAGCVPQGLSDVPNNDFTSLALPFCNP